MWFKYVLIGILGADIVITILRIGDTRGPVDVSDAAGTAIANLLIIGGLVLFWSACQ